MKTITVTVALLISSIAFSQTVDQKVDKVNNNISLAGEELLKYQKKQKTSMIMGLVGAGIMAMGVMQEDAKPVVVIGGSIASIGFVINISSLSNLKRSANHLKNYK